MTKVKAYVCESCHTYPHYDGCPVVEGYRKIDEATAPYEYPAYPDPDDYLEPLLPVTEE